MGAEICKVYSQDCEILLPLLAELNSEIPTSTWRQLFLPHWNNTGTHYGLKLLVDENLAGFLGLIFSQRNISGKEITICNWSSLIAYKQYRDGSTPKKLIYEAMKTENCVIVGLTPTDKLFKIYMDLGFKQLEDSVRLIPRSKTWLTKEGKKYIKFGEEVREHLTASDLQIYEDHRKFNCTHVVVLCNAKHLYLILKNCKYSKNKLYLPKIYFYLNELVKRVSGYSYLSKERKYAKIHYCNDYCALAGSLSSISHSICKRLNAEGLLIEERFLEGAKIKKSRKGAWMKSVYKSNLNTEINPTDIDSMYSELFLLDL